MITVSTFRERRLISSSQLQPAMRGIFRSGDHEIIGTFFEFLESWMRLSTVRTMYPSIVRKSLRISRMTFSSSTTKTPVRFSWKLYSTVYPVSRLQ